MSKRRDLRNANFANMARAARQQMALTNQSGGRKKNWEPDWRPFDQEW